MSNNHAWVRDESVTKCHRCQKYFSLILRRHHCRACGNIFCFACCDKTIAIPESYINAPAEFDYWNPSYYLKSLRCREKRVCDACHHKIANQIRMHDEIEAVLNPPKSLAEMANVSPAIRQYYMQLLQNIQYALPGHQYTALQAGLLACNADYLAAHSKYLAPYLKSRKWRGCTTAQAEAALDLLRRSRIKTCQELGCAKTCEESLFYDDCIDILYAVGIDLPSVLVEYLFAIIQDSPDEIILCHLPFFVTLVWRNNFNKTLQNALAKTIYRSQLLTYHVYWYLSNALEQSTVMETNNINNFLRLIDSETANVMRREYLFFRGLVLKIDDPIPYILEAMAELGEVHLPYNPSIILTAVDVDSIEVKTSHSKPVIITFLARNEGRCDRFRVKILFKCETVLNDLIVLNLMTLSDIILKENLNIDLGIVVYAIMPIGNDAGMIQIIDDAKTIYDINNQNKDVLKYILEKNSDKTFDEIKRRYTYSLVSYTLHSYFIGLGDRHLQNIMISADGAIFHIDFEFILGCDAYPLTGTNIKLNKDMLNVIGGQDSGDYEIYIDLCAQGLVLLRKYFSMFFVLLAQNPQHTIQHVTTFIESRFQPQQSDEMVVTELMTIINNASVNKYGDIREFLHYHSQEKTLQNGFNVLIRKAYEMFYDLTGH